MKENSIYLDSFYTNIGVLSTTSALPLGNNSEADFLIDNMELNPRVRENADLEKELIQRGAFSKEVFISISLCRKEVI